MLKLTAAALAASAIFAAPAFAEECAEPAEKPKRVGAAAAASASAEIRAEGGETAMKESGEKGGTEDINIGVGELQEGDEADEKPKRMAKAKEGKSGDFAVEHEMKESGEKGGTEDMNIGVGELQECTISKSTDKS